MSKKQFKTWAVGFTAAALKLITGAWIATTAFSAVAMIIAIYVTGQFSYLDTFISETNLTFRASVVTLLITRTVGNVFQYNDGAVFGTSRKEEEADG